MSTVVTLLMVVGVIVFIMIVFAIATQFTLRSRAARQRSDGAAADPQRAERAARYGAQAPAATNAIEEDGRDPR